MLDISFPEPAFRTRTTQNFEEIFDPLRKKWLRLTPEEWVRQNFIQYMVQVAKIPSSLIAIEREIRQGELRKRFDIVVFNRDGLPWMLVECKSMETALNENVLSQTLSYMSQLICPFMLITNGTYSYGWKTTGLHFLMMDMFPPFPAAG